MRRRTIRRTAALVAAVATIIPTGAAADQPTANETARTVRAATRDLRSPDAAEAVGYGQFMTCVREPGTGAMGTHWVNGTLVGDTVLDPARPEALMYATNRHGDLKIAGVEYLVFQAAWDAEHAAAPSMFGHEFHLVTAPNRYDLPPFYALHVWAWTPNPDGLFASWNRRVTCDHAAGDPI